VPADPQVNIENRITFALASPQPLNEKELEMSHHLRTPWFICLAIPIAAALACGLPGCSSSDDDDGGTAPPVDTTAPTQVSGFLALPGDGQVNLSWIIPQDPDFAGVQVRRAIDSPPTQSTGETVYDGTGTTYVDDGVVNDQVCHYAYATSWGFLPETSPTWPWPGCWSSTRTV